MSWQTCFGLGWWLACFGVVEFALGQQPAGSKKPEAALSAGQVLYARHCAACHATSGDGRGAAALFLYPKPRSFRGGKYRLVSTDNNVPTRGDLHAVLVRGMPGSSMPSWAHLSQNDRELLVDEVIRLTSDGALERYALNLKQQEQLTDEDLKDPEIQAEMKAYAKRQTTPGAPSVVPEISLADAAAIVRGKAIYTRQSCHSCHGTEGKGDGVQKMVDDEGFATRARDLTRGIYKGGHDTASLYRRIRYGMPGTPMPASQNLPPGDIVDLAHFLRSLSTEDEREAVVLKRRQIVAKRAAIAPIDPSAGDWSSAPATSIQTVPLWWRDDAVSDLAIQALHDGQALAIRLTWSDATENTRAVKPEEFEDMAALELYQGPAEPFLGMGGPETPIDLWQWRGGQRDTGEQDSLLDDYPFDTATYRELAKGKPLPDFITGRAAGNPLSTRETSGANLGAKGLGSLTFRPKPSQLVTANAAHSQRRWAVVLRRPLAVPAGGGLTLSAGQTCSAAFAIWDGAARDRGPQKSISIWHDFKLE
jgi:mono/diheme cytochrome c family protein